MKMPFARSLGDSAEVGATSAEYALLLSLIAIVIIAAVTFFGLRVDLLFSQSCSSLPGGGSC